MRPHPARDHQYPPPASTRDRQHAAVTFSDTLTSPPIRQQQGNILIPARHPVATPPDVLVRVRAPLEENVPAVNVSKRNKTVPIKTVPINSLILSPATHR